MRIEVLEDRLSDTDQETGQHHLLFKGDQREVSDTYGARLCKYGWVRDLDGNVETGTRKPGAEVLEPRSKTVKPRGRNRG